jgi:VWFA-related protein
VSYTVGNAMRALGLAVGTVVIGVSLLADTPAGQAAPPPQTPPAQQPPPQQQQPPVFRGGVDVIRLDVSVLDKDRNPVRGLTPENFTVVENGKTQRIVAVTEMAAAETDPTPSAWMRMVPPDVAANDLTDMTGDGRFVAIVMDDWNIPFDDHEIILNARAVGRYVVDALNPSDVAAIIYPQQAGKTQDFTTDRQKLIQAVDKFEPPEVRFIEARPMGPGPGGGDMPQRFAPVLMRSDCQRSQPTVPTLDTVVARLASVPNRRKTVILVSIGIPLTFSETRGCGGELSGLMKDVFRRAQQANVNIHSIDPAGYDGYLRYLQNPIRKGGRPAERTLTQANAEKASRVRREFLQITADHTGARAIGRTDELSYEIDRMFAEATSYYLIGYQTSNGQPDGKFRRIEVKVDRPGLTIRTRSGFYAPDESGKRDGESAPAPSELGLTGMSSAAALALRTQAVPLAPATGGKVDVAVILGVRTPGSRLSGADTLTLVRTLYDEKGKPGPPSQERMEVALPPATTDELRYEVFQRLALAPGRYELRLNASSAMLDTSGTVYAELEVPDFSRRTLAVSNLMLGAPRGDHQKDALADLLPIVPSTRRDFSPGEPVMAYARVYQGGAAAPAPITTTAQLINVSDERVWESKGEIPASAFDAARTAPLQIALPLEGRARGSYLFSVALVRPDGAKARIDLVFRIR